MRTSIQRAMTLMGQALLLASLASCGGEESGGGGPGGMPPMPVEVAEVRASGMTDEFTVIGDLDAEFEITVVAEIAAKVVELPFAEGEELAAGALIARLDDAQLQAEVQRADALVQQRRNIYERVQTIVQENAGAPQDLDDAAADLAVAKANLTVARSRLDKTRIEAPFRGVVGARLVSRGSYLRAGDPITELAQLDRLRVAFSVPEIYLGRLKAGATVQVRSSAYPDLELEGKVDIIDPVLDRSTRSVRLIALIENTDRRLRPGMSADVSVILDDRPQALTVPSEAVFFQGQQAFVYTVDENSQVALAPIFLGTRAAGAVEVTGGLEAGQTVIRAGHQKLFPGATVSPVGESAASDAEGEGTES